MEETRDTLAAVESWTKLPSSGAHTGPGLYAPFARTISGVASPAVPHSGVGYNPYSLVFGVKYRRFPGTQAVLTVRKGMLSLNIQEADISSMYHSCTCWLLTPHTTLQYRSQSGLEWLYIAAKSAMSTTAPISPVI